LAVDSGEYQIGVTCISAAIRTVDGVAAVAVSAPLSRQSTLVASADILRRSANRIGVALAAS
jgi:DNA-binding IclR family transcriptional regulator